jgi:Cu/Ag efflux protein CusF
METEMKKLATMTCLLAAALAAPAFAQQPSSGNHVAHHADVLADGEVRKVDKDAKKITIKHGPIPNLEMPAMTMVFQVKDPAMLEQVKPGDKVKFEAQKLGGAFTVTRIDAVK